MPIPARFGTALLLLLAPMLPALAGEPRVVPVDAPGSVSVMEPLQDKRVLVGMADGKWFAARIGQSGRIDFEPTVAPTPEPMPREIVPDSRPAQGTRDIRAAWLVEPVSRHTHGIMGDALEAGALRVTTSAGATLTARLPDDVVIEDLTPRIVDLDRDGKDEVLVVRSSRSRGASLAAYGITTGEGGQPVLNSVAESRPLGAPNRWLNPVGVADLDGDGRVEVAAVTTPHRNGKLVVYRREGDRLAEVATARGFSNHQPGSTELRMAAIVDTNGDGDPELVVPDAGRKRLRIMDFDGKALHERARLDLPAPVTTAVLPLGDRLILGVDGGKLVSILF